MSLLYCPRCDAYTNCSGQDFSEMACWVCGYFVPPDLRDEDDG